MERLKNMKETLMSCVQGQLTHLDQVDTKELGEVIDMIKDLSEAVYYCTITEAMEEKEKQPQVERYYYTEPMRYAYNGSNGGNSSGGNGNSSSGDGSSSSRSYIERDMDRNYGRMYYHEPMQEREYDISRMRDGREGRSPLSRRMYMESKEMHQPQSAQMKELERYLQELSADITEMVEKASPEEKQMMEQKISALAQKVNG